MGSSYIRSCAIAALAAGFASGSLGASAETASAPTGAPAQAAAPAPAPAPAAAPVAAAPAPAAAPAIAAPAPASQPTVPVAVSAESAAALATVIDSGLHAWFPSTGAAEDFQWTGKVSVVAAGDHFDVDLPSLVLTSEDGSKMTVGVVKLALTPNADESLGVGVTLPSSLALVARDGSSDGTITIGTQRFIGRWLPRVGTFVQMDGSYGDIKATASKNGARLAIGSIIARTDWTEAAAGRWSGPSSLVINRLDAVDEHGVQVMHLGSAAVEATMSGVDLATVSALGKQAGAKAGPDAKETEAALRRNLAMIQGIAAGFTGKMRVSDLAVTAPGDGSTFSIGQQSIHGSVDGLTSGRSTLSVGYDLEGLKVQPNQALQPFLPEKVEISIAAADLPNAALWSVLEHGATGESATGGDQIAAQLMAAMTQSNSRLRVDSLRVDTPSAAASLKGEARFDNKAAMGVVAGFDAVVRGLEAAVKQLQPAPGAKPDDDTQNLLAGLAMLQAMGAPGKDETGRDVRTYKLEVAADGKLLLNGADMSALLQPSPAARPAPAAPSAGVPGVPGKGKGNKGERIDEETEDQ